MPYPQPVANGDDGSDVAWAASDNDNAPTPDPPDGYGLDCAGYPGWHVGDMTSGQGLLGVAAPPEDQAAAQQAGDAVNQAFAMGYGRAAQTMPRSSSRASPKTGALPRNPLGQGYSDGFLEDFTGLYQGALSQARAFARNPLIWAIQAVPGIDPTNSMARGVLANEVNTIDGLNLAIKTNTVPYFIGNQAGHVSAKLIQFMAARGVLGPAVGAPPEALEGTPALGGGDLEPDPFSNAAQNAAEGGEQFGPSPKIDRGEFAKRRPDLWRQEAQTNAANYDAANLARMREGKPPIGPDGHPMEFHHVDGTADGGVKPMTRTQHRLGSNFKENHPWIKK